MAINWLDVLLFIPGAFALAAMLLISLCGLVGFIDWVMSKRP